jgi:hypothetical protein
MGFYGTKIAFSASKPNAVERRMGKLGDSVVNTTIVSKIELFDHFPIDKPIHLAVPCSHNPNNKPDSPTACRNVLSQ